MSQGIEDRLLNALASLNQIGRAINQIGSDAAVDQAIALRLIVDSAIQVVPGAAAVIYAYDSIEGDFDATTRVSAGEKIDPVPGERPRPYGMGVRAMDQRRRILSYEEDGLSVDTFKLHHGAGVVVCYPLIVADQPLGALYVYLYDERPFSQLELLMLDNFVNHAGMALFQIHRLSNVQRDLVRKEDELSRLRRAGLMISSSLRLEDTLRAILHMAMEVINAKYGIFRLMDATGQNLVTKAYAGDNLGHPFVGALSIDSPSVSAWVAKNRQPVCIADLQVEPWSSIYFPLDAEIKMRAELAVPLVSASGRLEGVINLESPLPNAFDEEDRHLLQALATQAVIAIQEVRLLDALQEIAEILLTQPEKAVLVRLVALVSELLNSKASSVWIVDGESVVLRVATAHSSEGERIPLEGSFPGRAIQAGGAVTVDRAMAQTYSWQPDLKEMESWSRAWAIPLMEQSGANPVGAFCVYGLADTTTGQGGGTEWENKIMMTLAHYAALAIFNSRHLIALQEAQEQHAVAEMFAAVGDIATNLLHQLNNKIGTIPVRIQGIQDKSHEALSGDRYLATNLAEIERSATEAMEAVRRNLSHLHPVRRVPVNLANCVRLSLANAKINPGVTVRMENLDDLPSVAAAQQNLALVFTNLLENADHAMKGKGQIVVHGYRRRGWVEVVVSDSGPGIPPEDHARIFELNFSGAAQPGKLGFGLWWVKTQIVRLGGTVSVESDGEHGTTFRLRLPAGGGEG